MSMIDKNQDAPKPPTPTKAEDLPRTDKPASPPSAAEPGQAPAPKPEKDSWKEQEEKERNARDKAAQMVIQVFRSLEDVRATGQKIQAASEEGSLVWLLSGLQGKTVEPLLTLVGFLYSSLSGQAMPARPAPPEPVDVDDLKALMDDIT